MNGKEEGTFLTQFSSVVRKKGNETKKDIYPWPNEWVYAKTELGKKIKMQGEREREREVGKGEGGAYCICENERSETPS